MNTTRTYAADLPTPSVILHRDSLGATSLKRVDEIEFLEVTPDPAIMKALGLDHGHQEPGAELMLLTGDNVHEDGTPAGDARGWMTYVWSDDHVFVVNL